MMTRLVSVLLFLAFAGLAACGDEDLEFGAPSETATPDETSTPGSTATPTPSPTASPTDTL